MVQSRQNQDVEARGLAEAICRMNSKADEIAYHWRPTSIGALMVAGREAVIAGEEERVHNVFEADPRLALT